MDNIKMKLFTERKYVATLSKSNSLIDFTKIYRYNKNYSFLKYKFPKDSKILELGPGKGFFVDYLIINGYKNITLVDIDKDNVLFLKKKYSNIKTINIFNKDAINFLKKYDQKFDLIITMQFIEHLADFELFDFFKYTSQLLKKNGILINETINSANLVYGDYHRYIDFSHQISFTPKSYIEFSLPFFETSFINYVFPHPVSLIIFNLRFSKKINLQLNKLKNTLKLDNSISSFTKNQNNSSLTLENFFKLLRYYQNYRSWNKSITFSKKFLKNEKILSPFFIAISHKK